MILRRALLQFPLIPVAGTALAPICAKSAGTQDPPGTWTPLADMPFPVQEIYPSAFVRNGSPVIVNAGGLTPAPQFPHNVADAVIVYDPYANVWTYGVKLPAPRHHIALTAAGGALYAIGGFARDDEGGWKMQRGIWRIENIDNGEWAQCADLPRPQAEAVTLSHNDLIHMIGGRSPIAARNLEWPDHADTGAHVVYDAADDEWSERAPLPTPRNSAAGAVIGGVLYVVSGRTVAGGNTPVCEAYDPATDTWRTIAPLPAPLRQRAPHGQGGLAAAAFGGKLYAFGGEWFGASSGVYADAWEYDPATDEWRAVAAMSRPRHGAGAVALDGGVYVVGGALGPSAERTSVFLDRFTV